MENKAVHPIDKMDGIQLTRELVDFFGTRRATELLGWAAIVTLLAWPKSVAEFRKEVEASGFNKSSMYVALHDMRRFGQFVEEREGWLPERKSVPADGLALLHRLGSLKTA